MAKASTKKPAAGQADEARHGIGGNQPPVHESLLMELEDVHLEASNYLDGADIETPAQADAVALFVKKARELKKRAEDARKAEKEPFLEAGRAVDEKFKPITARADLVLKAAQAPLTRWLEKLEAQKRAEAERIRREAEEAQRRASEAQREAEKAGNLDALEAAQRAQDDADLLHKTAKRAEKEKAQVGGGEGRAMGLRTVTIAEVVDYKALLQYIMRTDPQPLRDWLDAYATRAIPAQLDGVQLRQERRAQ